MKLQAIARRAGVGLTMVGATAALVAASTSPVLASSGAPLFTEFNGGGRGSTAELAIVAAIDDAENTAAGFFLYTCTVVGQPEVFEVFNHPYFGHTFFAEATVTCTP